MKRMCFFVFIVALGALLHSCGPSRMERNNLARQNADFILDNLNNPEVIEEFPEKYFPREETKQLLKDILATCDWSERNGKYVDFFEFDYEGDNETAFIYEYFLNCDSLRFVLTYDLDLERPELHRLIVEPLELPSQLINDRSKQLLNK